MIKNIVSVHLNALSEILKNKISFFYSFILTFFSVALFFIFSIWQQFTQVVTLNLDLFIKTKIVYKLFLETMSVLNIFTIILFAVYIFSLYLFFLSVTNVYYVKKNLKKGIKTNSGQKVKSGIFSNGFFGGLSIILSFIGFGCVACGQALIFSLLTFFFTGFSIAFAYSVAALVMILGIIFLHIAIYKNAKILANPNICII